MTARPVAPVTLDSPERGILVRRAQLYSRLTLVYNALEGGVAIAAGVMSGSVALLTFGIDSAIEVVASVAALWRLQGDADVARREPPRE